MVKSVTNKYIPIFTSIIQQWNNKCDKITWQNASSITKNKSQVDGAAPSVGKCWFHDSLWFRVFQLAQSPFIFNENEYRGKYIYMLLYYKWLYMPIIQYYNLFAIISFWKIYLKKKVIQDSWKYPLRLPLDMRTTCHEACPFSPDRNTRSNLPR